MSMRWRVVVVACVAAALCDALAMERAGGGGGGDGEEGEDGLPDAGLGDELALHQEESRNLRPRAYATPAGGGGGPGAGAGGGYNALPSGFRPSPSLAELAGYQQRPQHDFQPAPQQQHDHQQAPNRPPQRKFVDRQQQEQRPTRLQLQQQQEEEEEEERQEPDRLALLLQQSKFDCVGKQGGYYADQELNCEVFHYCQDSVKHSWICPDGFTFHQVHLICMPPTHDNICQKSAKYHFVNDYLYRPINEEEVQRKPNVSLKYSDRYYPSEVYHDDRYDQDDADDEEEEAPRRAPAPAPRPAPARPQGAPQVFRSAEEVNIPLLQRRPQRPYEFDF